MDQEEMVQIISNDMRNAKTEGNSDENEKKEFVIVNAVQYYPKDATEIEKYKAVNKSDIDNFNLQKLFYLIDRYVEQGMITIHNDKGKELLENYGILLISDDSNTYFKVPALIEAAQKLKNSIRFNPKSLEIKVFNKENTIETRWFNPYYFGLLFVAHLYYLLNYEILNLTDENKSDLLYLLSVKYGEEFTGLYMFVQGFLEGGMDPNQELKNSNDWESTKLMLLFDIPDTELVGRYIENPLVERVYQYQDEFKDIAQIMEYKRSAFFEMFCKCTSKEELFSLIMDNSFPELAELEAEFTVDDSLKYSEQYEYLFEFLFEFKFSIIKVETKGRTQQGKLRVGLLLYYWEIKREINHEENIRKIENDNPSIEKDLDQAIASTTERTYSKTFTKYDRSILSKLNSISKTIIESLMISFPELTPYEIIYIVTHMVLYIHLEKELKSMNYFWGRILKS